MLKSEFNRHTIAFLTIVLASIFLYPAALAGLVTISWLLFGLVILAGLLTLLTK
jgi:hypothetical protein